MNPRILTDENLSMFKKMSIKELIERRMQLQFKLSCVPTTSGSFRRILKEHILDLDYFIQTRTEDN